MTSYRYGYARVSTAEQTVDLQLDALRAAGGVDDERLFVEVASGSLTSRPRLDELLGLLRAGDTLVVWRPDRLGRNLAHLVATITELGERGVRFVSLTESIDMETAAGRLQFEGIQGIQEGRMTAAGYRRVRVDIYPRSVVPVDTRR